MRSNPSDIGGLNDKLSEKFSPSASTASTPISTSETSNTRLGYGNEVTFGMREMQRVQDMILCHQSSCRVVRDIFSDPLYNFTGASKMCRVQSRMHLKWSTLH